jgi:serine/threonine protein kinase
MSLTFGLGESHVFEIPKRFGQYEYVRTIGTGSFSVVFLVQSVVTRAFLACKVVSRQILSDLNMFDRFEQETRVLSTLSHPNIVRFEEVVFTEQLIFLVMEYCPRGDLYLHVASVSGLQEPHAKRLFYQIASALHYIHERDIAHRDLKPENILLDIDLNAKLADFGLCHNTSPRALLKTPCGSPCYAAPEILLNLEYDGKMADMWSLGVVLYSMVTGSMPWDHTNPIEMYRQIHECQIEIPDYLSLPLRTLLTTILVKDPLQRPTIEKVLESSWLAEVKGMVRASTTDYKLIKPQLNLLDVGSRLGGRPPLLIRTAKERTRMDDLPVHREGLPPLPVLMKRVPAVGKRHVRPNLLFGGS